SGKIYGCKVEVEIVGTGGAKATAVVDFGLAPTSTAASATIAFAQPVATTNLDPKHRLVGRLLGQTLAPGAPPTVWIF
ncbi:MAG TPA: hypothetical protein VFS00_23150, partial [Polyangiaceae bacterium]|nr:hypothetical protein [Polyangiaceae bacterium]